MLVAFRADGIGMLYLGGPLSPQVCTVSATSSVKNVGRKLSVLCCWATTSTVQTLATNEGGGGADELMDRLRL